MSDIQQVLQASLSSFGARVTGKIVKPSSVTLYGSTDGVTYTAIAADQYLVALDSGLVRKRTLDDSNNGVDWSSYVSWQADYTVLSASGAETSYAAELVTGASANDGLFVLTDVAFSVVGLDGQLVADFVRFLSVNGPIAAAGGYMAGWLLLDASGGIWQGTGTPASPTTGLKFYNAGGIGVIEGWNGGVLQVALDSSGQLTAAYVGGLPLVRIGNNGIELLGSRTGTQTYSYGPFYPGTAADDSSHGTVAWSNPNNAKLEDGAYAEADQNSAATTVTHYLKLTNFGMNIPADATITRVKVEVKKLAALPIASGNSAKDETLKLVKGGTVSGASRADTSTPWRNNPTFFEWVAYDYDLTGSGWNVSLAPSDLNANDFGVVLAATLVNASGTLAGEVEAVRVTITGTRNATIAPFQAHGQTLQGLADGVNASDAATVNQIGGIAVSAVLGSDFTTTSNSPTLVDVTGLSFAIGASETWNYEFHLTTNQSSNTGLKVGLDVNTFPLSFTVEAQVFGTDTAGTFKYDRMPSDGSAGAAFNNVAADGVLQITGTIVNSAAASGTVTLMACRGASAGTVTIYAGSYVIARKVG